MTCRGYFRFAGFFQRLFLLPLCLSLAGGCAWGLAKQRDYRQDMRDFVGLISAKGKQANVNFIVIPQNGHELLTVNGEADGAVAQAYLDAIDGVGREDLFYGYGEDNVATPAAEWNRMSEFMDAAEAQGVHALVTDYCSTQAFIDDSYSQSETRGYVSFAADERDLTAIPAYPAAPYEENSNDIATLTDAQNFLYLINPSEFASREAFLTALGATNYDVLIVDLFFEEVALTAADIALLRTKANGAARLVIAYLSIGEAEDYRNYWDPSWTAHPPAWLAEENPDWPGNFKVRYWDPSWQEIIVGEDSNFTRILDAHFDGVYLDIIDAYEYFEAAQEPGGRERGKTRQRAAVPARGTAFA